MVLFHQGKRLRLSLVVILHAAATFFMCGLIWFVQIVHYPLFECVPKAHFADYEKANTHSTGWVVIPPMLVELLTGIMVIWNRPAFVPLGLAWAGFALLMMIWLSTAVWQAPKHRSLLSGFDEQIHRSLVTTNWVRTIGWTARSLFMVYVLLGM
jgi:hypothetical protein